MKGVCVAGVLFAIIGTVVGQSPTPSGESDEQRVDSILSKMTLEEKIDLLGGINFFQVRGVPRLGLPVLVTADSPFGVRSEGRATLFAGGINLAATWDVSLAQKIGTQIGREARAHGVHFNLGPGVNIYRAPMNGRNFEYFGEDPFLAARIAVGYINGVQSQGVSATIKHFLGNNSEFARHTSDSIIDERALREIYLPAFEAAVKEARVGAIMDSYNLTNGSHMTENARLNIEVVKKEWGFTGLIMSDWISTYDTLGVANGGMDLEMPFGQFLNRGALLPLIQQGKVSEATIDDKVRRLLRLAVRFGWLDRPQADPSIPAYNQQGRQATLQAAREGAVLLKNEGNLLPLDKSKTKSIAVIGPNAYPAVSLGGGSATIVPFRTVSVLEGVSDLLGTSARVTYSPGILSLNKAVIRSAFAVEAGSIRQGLKVEIFKGADLSGAPTATRIDRRISEGKEFDIGAMAVGASEPDFLAGGPQATYSVRWTGFFTPKTPGNYDLFVQLGGFGESGYRLFVDGKLLEDRWKITPAMVEQISLPLDLTTHKVVLEYHGTKGFISSTIRAGIVRQGNWVDPAAEKLAANADVVILSLGFDASTESEGFDRSFRLPPGQQELIERITAANPRTIVVVNSGGGFDTSGWLERVPALLEAWYPGQEGGRAIAEILLGDVNPSGRLPATFERRLEDNPAYENYYTEPGTNRISYKEGIFVGYRGYQKKGTKPLFPFGFGLSYTSFKYDNLKISSATEQPSKSQFLPPMYQVSFDVKNIGSRAGTDVAQLYVGELAPKVERPAAELKGFARVDLAPGETKSVSITLDARAFAYFDVAGKRWHADSGRYQVQVGRSSEDVQLRSEIALPHDLEVKLDK
jgi:beta-glucosidase